jgi:3-hydroxyisobutyrate dehydrogenase/glyoxylate/succinic semialdehyde reductase
LKISFIGLGIMGSRMAANLLAQGHTLTVHNRTREKATALLEQGATWAEHPAAAAAHADVLITMLAHPEAVQAAALGEIGFLDALAPDALWIDCSTVNPSFSRLMATEARQRHVRFVDAPVAGSKTQAANAELVFFAGGSADDVAEAQPLFSAMGRRVVHVGEPGMGTSAKMVVNVLLATSMAAFAEGVALGRSLGITEDLLLNMLIGGPVAAPFLAGKQPKLTTGDYIAEFPLQWMHKDLRLAMLTASETGADASFAGLAQEVYRLAIEDGHGESDFSAVYAYVNKSR